MSSTRLHLPQTRDQRGRWVGPYLGRPTATRQPNVIVPTAQVRQAPPAEPPRYAPQPATSPRR